MITPSSSFMSQDAKAANMSIRFWINYQKNTHLSRSSKGICSCIVEGYGRKRYKNDFVKFLVYAQASCDETGLHLNFIHDSGHIDDRTFEELKEENDKLGRKINKFIQYVNIIAFYLSFCFW